MSALAAISEKVAKYPHLKTVIAEKTISVAPASEDGFSVWLTEKNPGYTVGFDGWHEEFESETEALEAFAFGLSESCRLRITYRGSSPCSWTCESNKDGRWIEDSTTGVIFSPFWKRKTVVYRQNHTIQ